MTYPTECENFLNFSSEKINITQSFYLESMFPIIFFPCLKLCYFDLFSLQTCREISLKLKPTFSPHIPPSHFLKQIFDTIISDDLLIINNSLLTGTFPVCFKLATVTHVLKKPTLNSAVYANYRPILNLSLSKTLDLKKKKKLNSSKSI